MWSSHRASRESRVGSAGRPGAWLLGVALLFLTAGLSLLPDRAESGERRCASRALTVKDYVAARAAATRALKDHLPLAAELPGVCRNPMRAEAWFESARRQGADGVTEWWEARCSRDSEFWQCEGAVPYREFEMEATLGGAAQSLKVRLTPTGEVAAARRLAALVVRAVPVLDRDRTDTCAALPEPGDSTRLPPGRQLESSPREPLILETTDDGGIYFWSPLDVKIHFREDPAMAGRLLACWDWMIIVD